MGHILRRNSILLHVIQGKIEVTGKIGRYKQLLDDLEENRVVKFERGEFAWEEAIYLSHDGPCNDDSKSCNIRDCRHERFARNCNILNNKTLSVTCTILV